MTPLQEAARAVRDRLQLPACDRCGGKGEIREWLAGETERGTCPDCGGGGVDTSNPDALTGRAVRWLQGVGRSVFRVVESLPDCSRRAPRVGLAVGSSVFSMRGTRVEAWVSEPEWPDGTPEGYAAAFLRLVARCEP